MLARLKDNPRGRRPIWQYPSSLTGVPLLAELPPTARLAPSPQLDLITTASNNPIFRLCLKVREIILDAPAISDLQIHPYHSGSALTEPWPLCGYRQRGPPLPPNVRDGNCELAARSGQRRNPGARWRHYWSSQSQLRTPARFEWPESR